MKKANRVCTHEEFTRIIHERRAVRGKYVTLYTSPKAKPETRIGISVGKRNGKAVIRVKIKRQIRAICEEANLINRLSADLIIAVKPEYETKDFVLLKEDLLRCVAAIGEQNIENQQEI